ncbi:hypothetical protein Pelo_2481 [Pelomyxa schiedti]|nr:hypothetical protein Pelo_2481 [Pelomyxa schiedti]
MVEQPVVYAAEGTGTVNYVYPTATMEYIKREGPLVFVIPLLVTVTALTTTVDLVPQRAVILGAYAAVTVQEMNTAVTATIAANPAAASATAAGTYVAKGVIVVTATVTSAANTLTAATVTVLAAPVMAAARESAAGMAVARMDAARTGAATTVESAIAATAASVTAETVDPPAAASAASAVTAMAVETVASATVVTVENVTVATVIVTVGNSVTVATAAAVMAVVTAATATAAAAAAATAAVAVVTAAVVGGRGHGGSGALLVPTAPGATVVYMVREHALELKRHAAEARRLQMASMRQQQQQRQQQRSNTPGEGGRADGGDLASESKGAAATGGRGGDGATEKEEAAKGAEETTRRDGGNASGDGAQGAEETEAKQGDKSGEHGEATGSATSRTRAGGAGAGAGGSDEEAHKGENLVAEGHNETNGNENCGKGGENAAQGGAENSSALDSSEKIAQLQKLLEKFKGNKAKLFCALKKVLLEAELKQEEDDLSKRQSPKSLQPQKQEQPQLQPHHSQSQISSTQSPSLIAQSKSPSQPQLLVQTQSPQIQDQYLLPHLMQQDDIFVPFTMLQYPVLQAQKPFAYQKSLLDPQNQIMSQILPAQQNIFTNSKIPPEYTLPMNPSENEDNSPPQSPVSPLRHSQPSSPISPNWPSHSPVSPPYLQSPTHSPVSPGPCNPIRVESGKQESQNQLLQSRTVPSSSPVGGFSSPPQYASQRTKESTNLSGFRLTSSIATADKNQPQKKQLDTSHSTSLQARPSPDSLKPSQAQYQAVDRKQPPDYTPASTQSPHLQLQSQSPHLPTNPNQYSFFRGASPLILGYPEGTAATTTTSPRTQPQPDNTLLYSQPQWNLAAFPNYRSPPSPNLTSQQDPRLCSFRPVPVQLPLQVPHTILPDSTLGASQQQQAQQPTNPYSRVALLYPPTYPQFTYTPLGPQQMPQVFPGAPHFAVQSQRGRGH